MVEFRFDIRPLFEQSIIKVTSNLLPHTFRGDRRQCLDATSKMSEVIDRLGLLSAHAQKLNKPVTTAQRLRMSENQVIYIMADVTDGNNGKVLGLLKVGTKDLYLFDETGRTRKVPNAPSILDFYIHESRQRSGLGKELFETMLADEGWTPIKCSIDRPSEKLLAFFKKHYGLVRVIPQANNFVLYEGFFDPDDTDNNKNIDKQEQLNQKASNGSMMHITNSPNTHLFGATYFDNDDDYNKKRRSRHLDTPSNNITAQMAQLAQIAPAGRYGARRPTCSMAEIIHNGPPPTKSGAATSSSVSVLAASTSTITPTVNHKNNLTIINNLTENFQNVSINASGEQEIEGDEENREDYEEEGVKESNMDNGHYGFNNDEQQEELPIEQTVDGTIQFDPATDLMMNNETVTHDDSVIPERNIIQNTTPTRYQNSLTIGAAESGRAPRGHRSPTSASVIGNGVLRKPPPTFQLSKQHTGMKNRSDGVGMAVTPTNKMEFVQENREEFGVLKIHRPIGHKPALSPSALTLSKRLSPNNHHYNYNNNNHNDNNNNNHEESDDAVSTASSKEEGALTQQGYYDMKFFHNKLW